MKSKEPGTIRQLFAFVGENNGKMLLSIFLAVLGELFGIGPYLMVAVLADALYRRRRSLPDHKNAAYLAVLPDVPQNFLYHTEKYPGGHYRSDGEDPHGRHAGNAHRSFQKSDCGQCGEAGGLHGPFHAGTAL